MNRVQNPKATKPGSKKQKQTLNRFNPAPEPNPDSGAPPLAVYKHSTSSPSLMIFLAATADDRWMGSMKMLAASELEMVENLDSETMEKLRGQTLVKEQNGTKSRACLDVLLPGGGTAQVAGLNSVDARLLLWTRHLLRNISRLMSVLAAVVGGRHGN